MTRYVLATDHDVGVTGSTHSLPSVAWKGDYVTQVLEQIKLVSTQYNYHETPDYAGRKDDVLAPADHLKISSIVSWLRQDEKSYALNLCHSYFDYEYAYEQRRHIITPADVKNYDALKFMFELVAHIPGQTRQSL